MITMKAALEAPGAQSSLLLKESINIATALGSCRSAIGDHSPGIVPANHGIMILH